MPLILRQEGSVATRSSGSTLAARRFSRHRQFASLECDFVSAVDFRGIGSDCRTFAAACRHLPICRLQASWSALMQILKNTVVTLDYSVSDPDGNVVDPGREPLIYLHGGHDDIFPKIEEALHEKVVGDTVEMKLQPDEAFGEYDEQLIQVEPRDSFPDPLEIGMQFEGSPEQGDEDDFVIFRVTEISGDKVILDGNHPLAGTALIFKCTVTAVRQASEEEIEHGHVHDGDPDDESAPRCH
jgi:FKBP-type peptidyl-prolyl cis-trans isomerase SlyD